MCFILCPWLGRDLFPIEHSQVGTHLTRFQSAYRSLKDAYLSCFTVRNILRSIWVTSPAPNEDSIKCPVISKHGSCSSFVSQRSKLSAQQAKSVDPRLISPLSEAPNLHQLGSIREKNKTYDIHRHTQAYGLTTSFGHGSRHKPCQTCHCSRWGSP